MLWILGAVTYLVILTVIFALMCVSGAADRDAERMYQEWQKRQGELKKQKLE